MSISVPQVDQTGVEIAGGNGAPLLPISTKGLAFMEKQVPSLYFKETKFSRKYNVDLDAIVALAPTIISKLGIDNCIDAHITRIARVSKTITLS